MIPLSVPHIAGNEWQYIKECLDTEWVSSAGKYVDLFEQQVAKLAGSKFAIACVNGTAALQVALEVAGLKPDEEVIVPTLTFIASVNAVRYNRAEPIFFDCDDYYCLNIDKIIEFIRQETIFKHGASFNRKTGKRIRALVAVHVFGNAVNLEPLLELCHERGILVVEDAAESIGTVYRGGKLDGKATGVVGDIGFYSFNGNKIITTGGGGMIVTNNSEYAERARYLTTQAKDDEVRYIHHNIGYNYRLTNIQAALGVAQLEKLGEYIERKRTNYQYFKQAIDQIPGLHLAEVPPYCEPNYWFYNLQIDKDIYGRDREELLALFTAEKIQVRPVWYLNHWQKPYVKNQTYKIEKAIQLFEKTLNIPCSVNLTTEQRTKVIEVLKNGQR